MVHISIQKGSAVHNILISLGKLICYGPLKVRIRTAVRQLGITGVLTNTLLVCISNTSIDYGFVVSFYLTIFFTAFFGLSGLFVVKSIGQKTNDFDCTTELKQFLEYENVELTDIFNIQLPISNMQ